MTSFYEELRLAGKCIINCFTVANFCNLEISTSLAFFDSSLRISGLRDESISSVFRERAIIHSGDGLSKETAIFFKKARTYFEAMEMLYRYLDRRSLSRIGQYVVEGDERYVFDVISTAAGELWFKLPKAEFA